MRRKMKKPLSILLAFALVFGMFAAMPMTAHAGDTTIGILETNAVLDIQINIQTAINTANSGDTITVIGSRTGVAGKISLDLNNDVTVVWKAAYSGSTTDPLIVLEGSNTFEIAAGGSIVNNGTGPAVEATGFDVYIKVTGGTVEAKSAAAIHVSGVNARVIMNDGVLKTVDGFGIRASGFRSSIVMNGGTVSVSDRGMALAAHGQDSSVMMNGGTASGGTGTGIGAVGVGSIVNMTGGTVTATTGVAIGAIGDKAEINVSNGTVGVTTGIGIGAMGVNSSVKVTGGTVSATKAAAIATSGDGAKVSVNGGFVFAYGTAITGEGNVINMVGGATPTIGGTAVVCAWKDSTTATYTTGTSDDLIISPAGASATWGKSGTQDGINYTNGANTGFFPVSLVTVNTSTGFTVTFNPNGGSSVAGQTVNTGYKVTKPADPLRPNFVFAGWYTDAALTNAYNFDAPVSANLTLYAKWTAVGAPSMSNFTKIRNYTPGMFTDVNENSWYGYNQQRVIARAYEYGLMQGNSATIFNPTGNITVAEALAVASRVHRIYTSGSDDIVQSGVWYQVFVDYAKDNNIIVGNEFTSYTRTATRAEMAYIFSRSLPQSEFASKNTVLSLPDVNNSTSYSGAIVLLYKAGVLAGSDDKGTFNPTNNITRAEAAAIISRVILPDTRISGRTF